MELPSGFRQGASGLILPEAASRRRRTLLWDEWRVIDRATKVLAGERFTAEIVMRCSSSACPDRKIERVRHAHGMILRCGCTDRCFEKAL